MKIFWLLVRQEMRIIFSDKKALALLFLMPSILIIFLSLALKDVYQQKVGRDINVVILTDESLLADSVVQQFSQFNYSVTKITSHLGIADHLVKTDTDVVLEIPKDLASLIKGTGGTNKIKMFFDPSIDKAYTELIKSHFLISVQSTVIDQVNNKLTQMQKPGDDQAVQINKLAHAKNLIEEVGEKQIIPNPLQQTVPAWALFAMFFISLPMSTSFIRDRESGSLKRLLCYNIGKPTLLLGKIIPYIIINNIQFYLMLFLGLYLVPWLIQADFTLGIVSINLLVVSLVCSIASTSYGLIVSTLARSSEQASSLGALLVVIMALFGGVMIPHFVMPSFMQKLAIFSPLYWGLESYFDVFLRDSSLGQMAHRLFILMLFSLIAFLVSLQRFSWSSK